MIGDSSEQLSDIDKTAYVLGSELWEENFEDTLRLVKEFIVDVWEVRKQKLYGEDACPSHHQCQTLAGDAGPVTEGGGLRVSKLQGKGKLGKFHVQVCSGNVHTSAPPIVMGAWSMAFLLGQHVEYYYCVINLESLGATSSPTLCMCHTHVPLYIHVVLTPFSS